MSLIETALIDADRVGIPNDNDFPSIDRVA